MLTQELTQNNQILMLDDFKKKSIDGLGEDWPIGYDDIKPYYDKVDKLIGVFGTKENIYNEPSTFSININFITR